MRWAKPRVDDAIDGDGKRFDCREGIEGGLENLHIDGGKSTVGDGAAESTGNGESGVEGSAAELLRSLSLDDGSNWGGSGHCECLWGSM